MDDSVETLDVAALVALYFDAALPDERDAVFAEIAARPAFDSRDFMQAVMAHDADPFMQADAAAALWRQGDRDARKFLADLVQHTGDELLLEQALDALLQAEPQQQFAQALALWQDAARPTSVRRLALLAMERADAAQSIAIIRPWLAAWRAPESVELLGMAAMALVRSGAAEDAAALQGLRARAQAELGPEAEADTTVVDLCDEALALWHAQGDLEA